MSPNAASDPPPASAPWFSAALVAVLVFAVFAGYAFLAPALYRTSALVEVWPADASNAVRVEPLQAARRLHEVLLDSEALARLAAERAPGASAEVLSQAASSIESALQIDSVDARTFTLSFRDSDAARVAASCNWLAERMVERAPRVLGPDIAAQQRTLENERRRRVSALVAYLAAHPEVSGRDVASAVPAANDEGGLVRRLAELNGGSQSKKGVAKPLPPEVTQILADLSQNQEAAKALALRGPTLKARLVTRAPTPTWPLEPDRPRLLLIGFVSALVASALFFLVGRRRRDDYGESTPPPGMSSYPPPDATPEAPPLRSSHPPPSQSAPEPAPSAAAPAAPAATVESPLRIPLEPVPRIRSPLPFAASRPVPSAPPRGNEGDRITPVSSLPPKLSSRSDRGPRAAQEVNAGVPATDKRPSGSPHSSTPKALSARTTHVLGSPIPPIIAPGSRRSLAGGSGEHSVPPPVSTTAYSYVSTPPPEIGPSSRPRQQVLGVSIDMAPHSSGPPTRPYATSPPLKDTSVVQVLRAPVGWRHDLSLLPESRRNVCDEIYPFAVDNCCVVGVLGGADSGDIKSRLAAELALALAESGHTRVLLLDADLERPNVRRFLRVEMPLAAGFSEQMRARITSGVAPWRVLECSASLHVLAEGAEASPELILSRPFEDCLSELRRYYDFIVIDGPLVANTAACRAVDDVIDRIVFSHGRFGPAELAQANTLFPGKRILVVPAFS